VKDPGLTRLNMTFRPILALLMAASASLLGCSHPSSAPVQETQLSVKQIIANAKIDQLFVKQVDAKNVAVGPDRAFISAEGHNRRGACYRAEVGTLIDPKQRRTVTFVALVEGNQLIDRRSAKTEDHCELDTYERVGPLPSSEN